jgi:redox-sensing transcriptional repressor
MAPAKKTLKIPEVTIGRLSAYLRCLEKMHEKGGKVVSSSALAKNCGVNAAQVRKDLAYFGKFGIRGVGYYVEDLYKDIKNILGIDKVWKMAIFGVGNLGTALLSYKDFLKQNYRVVAVFDTDRKKLLKGKIAGIPVYHPDQLEMVIRKEQIDICLITAPVHQAQDIVNRIVKTKIRGILNFAPVQLNVPEGLIIKNVFFTNILDKLVYLLCQPQKMMTTGK